MHTRPFHIHEDDKLIMRKKDQVEVRGWTRQLEFINSEIDYLVQLDNQLLKNTSISRELSIVRRENTLLLAALCRYENSMAIALECDDVACDAFYLNNHEKHREAYEAHLGKYRELKTRIYSGLLEFRVV